MFAKAGDDQAAFRSFIRTQGRRVCMSRRRPNETCGLPLHEFELCSWHISNGFGLLRIVQLSPWRRS